MVQLIEVSLAFRSMNTDVEAVVCVPEPQRPQGDQALKLVQDLFMKVEETLSRFIPDSELSRLNSSTGKIFKASPMLFEVVRAALDTARDTNGIFDPTVLPYLISAGYDRSFEIRKQHQDTPYTHQPLHKCIWKDINLDQNSSSIYLPEGCIIDLGGIGKGWAVDRASQYLKSISGYAIDAGGDIHVGGTQADGTPWTVGVADPLVKDRDLTTFSLSGGALCTSTTTKRKWKSGGIWQHHIIDPRSGEPSDSGVISATIIAESAARAETIAKTALILGPEDGFRFIENQGDLQGMLVLADGRWLTSNNFPEVQHVA